MRKYTSGAAAGNFYGSIIFGIVSLIIGCYGVVVGDVLAAFIVAPPIFCMLLYENYLFSVHIVKENNEFNAYLFKNKICTVSTEKKIYYKIFIAKEGNRREKKSYKYKDKEKEFIMFSNEPFEYNPYQKNYKGSVDNYLHRYDQTKQILMPYNTNENILFLEIEKWDRIRLE